MSVKAFFVERQVLEAYSLECFFGVVVAAVVLGLVLVLFLCGQGLYLHCAQMYFCVRRVPTY